MKTKLIYKKSLAKELVKRGAEVIGAYPNKHQPTYKVYVFNETEQFTEALNAIMEEERQEIVRELLED